VVHGYKTGSSFVLPVVNDEGKARECLARLKVNGWSRYRLSASQQDECHCEFPETSAFSMAIASILSVLLWLSLHITITISEYTNLLDVPPGLFEVSTRIEINTTRASAYDTLCDFPNYSAWNPFVRYAVVTSPSNITLPDQRPIEGALLFMRVQNPPLPLPVDKNTVDNPLNTQVTLERITHVEPQLGRLAWVYLPEQVLTAERWQAVSDMGDGTVLYEAREVFSGPAAQTLKDTVGKSLQESFDGQGKGLKMWLEGGGS
jgi:hypothetical protein